MTRRQLCPQSASVELEPKKSVEDGRRHLSRKPFNDFSDLFKETSDES